MIEEVRAILKLYIDNLDTLEHYEKRDWWKKGVSRTRKMLTEGKHVKAIYSAPMTTA
jgi:hypothetical protein